MKRQGIIAILGVGLLAAACASVPDDQSIADYCASPDNSREAICRMNVEIEGNTTALADTKLSLEEARAVADAAQTSADEARERADAAQQRADEAMSMANQALTSGDLDCITNTVNNSDIGTCPDTYTVMNCTQTRYTTRAGGLSFLREVTNEQCRFNSQVLEMDVRCCRRSGDNGAQQSSMPDNS